jgi:hypothetical protein
MHIMEETPFKPLSEMQPDQREAFQFRQDARAGYVKGGFKRFQDDCLAEATVGIKVGAAARQPVRQFDINYGPCVIATDVSSTCEWKA